MSSRSHAHLVPDRRDGCIGPWVRIKKVSVLAALDTAPACSSCFADRLRR